MNAWKWAGVGLLTLASAVIFTWYLRPDMVVSASNAFLAMCGF